jgi:hypothetical protein
MFPVRYELDSYLYCDGYAQSIARQRLGKHVPTHAQRNSRSVFYVVLATQQWKSCVFCVVNATQQQKNCVFCVVRATSI